MRSISASRIKTFQSCPRLYKYRYIYKLLEDKSQALEVGTRYHSILENYHSGRHAEVDNIIHKDKKYSKILQKLFDKYLKNPVEGNIIETEHEFSCEIEGIPYPLYGFVDRIDEDKGVEYKTTSVKWKEEDTDNIQTDIYLYVLLKFFGRPMPIVYSINNKKTNMPPQEFRIEKTEEEILEVEEKVEQFIKDVEKSNFEPTPSSFCYMCAYGNKGCGLCIDSK